ncbi:MAG: hypothetical protein ACR2NU_13615 [Aeoliella sp.]
MNTNNKRQIINGCLAVGLFTLLSACVHAQTPRNWTNTDVGGGDWDDFNNWDVGPPQANFDELGNIGNTGTAFVAGPVFDVAGITIPNGTLEIRSGGTLASTPGDSVGSGAVTVGQGSNQSHLQVLPGGTFTAASLTSNAGSSDTSVELSGNGSLTVQGNANLERTTRITGNAATFDVGGDLSIGGNFISEITHPTTHSAINVTGGVTINSDDAVLNLEFGGGVTPSGGDSWTLVSGSSGITGGFSSIVGPALGGGLGYKASAAGGNLSVSVSSLMTLKVNRATGAASINGGTEAIDMELYAIGSPGGHLTPGTWASLDAAGFDNDSWLDGNPSGNPNGLAEARANPLGSSTIGIAQSQSVGSIFNTTGLTFAENRDDLTFSYLEPGSTILTNGIVEYEGPHNNLVLVVDPTTGDAVIHNQSAFDATINLYAIASESGALLHDPSETVGVGWDSFEETGVDGGVWQRGSGSAEVLAEANPASATTISSGTQIGLGTPWDMTSQDLIFEFLLEGDSVFTQGIVEYASIIAIPGDYNGDGIVNAPDYTVWRDGDSPDDTIAGYNLWKANYGNSGSGSSSAVSSVPEPTSLTLFAWCALVAILRCRSRNG